MKMSGPTDPDYCWDGNHLHWCVFDEEGFLLPPPSEHRALIEAGKDILDDVLEPGRILDEPDYHYPEALGRAAGLRTEGGAVQTKVQPDLAVLPEGWDDGQLPKSRVLRVDADYPVPELIVEIASPSTAARDRGGKRELYRALGVREYLILDPGRPDGGDLPARPARLTLYRLWDGDYVQADGGQDPASSPSGTDGVAEVLEPVHSEVCGTSLRLLRPEPEARVSFQWYEPATGRWRDRATDQAAALLASRAEGRVEALLQLLERALPEAAFPRGGGAGGTALGSQRPCWRMSKRACWQSRWSPTTGETTSAYPRTLTKPRRPGNPGRVSQGLPTSMPLPLEVAYISCRH